MSDTKLPTPDELRAKLAEFMKANFGELCTTIKNTFDGLVYGLLTGGVFGWLWPR